jgi:uncharacterized protein (TIRG00374 family)
MNAHAIALPEPQSQGFSVKRALGCLLALAGLVWVFHDIQLHQLLSVTSITNWWLIAASVFFDVLTYVLQGIRWRLLLAPVGRLRPLRATQAIYAGLFTNEVVPLRFGEVVRAFLVSRWLGSGIGVVVPSMIVERFLDALWLVVGLGLAAMFVPLPKNLVNAGDLLGAVVLAATIVFVCIVFRRKHDLECGPGEQAPKSDAATGLSSSIVSRLARGLCEIGVSRSLYGAVALSAGMLACQVLAIWFIMLAFGLKLSLLAGAVVVLIVRLGTAIPNAPANVGSFQFFTVLALGLFGVEKTVAAAFSIVDFFILTAPLWIIGFFALSQTGMGLSDIRAGIGSLRWPANSS